MLLDLNKLEKVLTELSARIGGPLPEGVSVTPVDIRPPPPPQAPPGWRYVWNGRAWIPTANLTAEL